MVAKQTMKTLQIFGAEHADLIEVPIPEPGPGELLVQVKEVATCPQWDLHIYYGRPMFAHEQAVAFPYSPGQPGHEMAGIVAAAGPGCTLKAGQKVAAWRDAGHHRAGCYAQYVVMKEEHLLPIPEHVPFRKAVSLELGMCVAASVMKLKQFEGIRGRRCGVNGLGPAGLIAVQMLLAEGAAEVIGLDPNPQRRELAIQLGATYCCEPESEELAKRGKPGALDLAIDCVGYPQAVRNIMDRTNTAVALFAVQRDDYTLRHQGLSVIGYPGHFREAAEYALALIVNGKLDFEPLISCELPLAEYSRGVEMLRRQEAVKICFIPGE
ncbi:zinc-binding dehydrogenase [Paenibacillus mesophilus]|uniref:zinc-dependent alcohol dehydrogenase n=1 Tax=Paenibacillus mesophilus TaxID=2582849 RepID=UPI00110F13A1|nr:zinc-binding dehydrogenase [Paenibacillus mesophilus]TMV48946.1 zinc-binding dehydrogenase [Paenibacillus mesophilus]